MRDPDRDFLNLALAGFGCLLLFFIVYGAYLTQRDNYTSHVGDTP